MENNTALCPSVKEIAALAKVSVSETEAEAMERDFREILAFAEQLVQEEVLPMDEAEEMQLSTVLRPDEPGRCLTREEALANATERTQMYFDVPKAID